MIDPLLSHAILPILSPTMPSDHVKVLNTGISGFGMRVLIALEEKGIPYDYQEEDLQNKSQLLLDSNPIHKKIPVLIHNGKSICESLIIVQYIDEAWPSPHNSLLPETPFERSVARFWADYIDKKLLDAGVRIVNSPAGELHEQAKKDFLMAIETLDKALKGVAGEKPFFGGDSIGMVDIALAPVICWFHAYEVTGDFKLPDEEQCPHLRAWMKRVVEYPSVKKSMALAPSEEVLEFAQGLRKRILGL